MRTSVSLAATGSRFFAPSEGTFAATSSEVQHG
jgi:hypothetical protein